MKTPTRRALLVLPVLCFALAVGAEDQHDDPAAAVTPPATAEPAPSTEQPRRQEQQQEEHPFEVFVPSEQISEDLPVPFPVDI